MAGYPAAAVLQAGATDNLVFLHIPTDVLSRVLEDNPYYTLAQIPASVYDTPEDISALAVDNILIVNAHADPATVFAIVSAIYDNLPELRRTIAVARQIEPARSTQLAIPLHPGAERYFRAAGVPGSAQ